MKTATENLEFEKAALIRDQVIQLRRELAGDEEGIAFLTGRRKPPPSPPAPLPTSGEGRRGGRLITPRRPSGATAPAIGHRSGREAPASDGCL
jgi:hypothetical protein